MRWVLLSALAASGCDVALQIDHVTLPDAAIDAPADAPPACPADYVIVEGSSQYRLVSTATDFLMAASDCADDETSGAQISMHTHLAVISDATERDFLYGLGNIRWIGLSDLALKNTWRWVTAEGAMDPSATDTMLWAIGEPNYPDTEMCAHFDSGHTGRVNNVVCTEAHTYTCECDSFANDPSAY